MDLSKSSSDPHGVQALLARLRAQQDSSSSSTPLTPPAGAPLSPSSPTYSHLSTSAPTSTSATTTYPGLRDSYSFDDFPLPSTSAAPFPPSTTTATKRKTYNDQPRFGSGYPYPAEADPYDPYGYTPAPASSHGAATPSKPPSTSSSSTTRVATALAPRPTATPPSDATQPVPPSLRDLSFPSALPHLSKLSTTPSFLAALRTLQTDQHTLERTLHTSYTAFRASLRPSLDPKTRRYEERKFLRGLLDSWDQARRDQQKRLQELHVPCCFVTDEVARCKRQKRVVEVLEGMAEE